MPYTKDDSKLVIDKFSSMDPEYSLYPQLINWIISHILNPHKPTNLIFHSTPHSILTKPFILLVTNKPPLSTIDLYILDKPIFNILTAKGDIIKRFTANIPIKPRFILNKTALQLINDYPGILTYKSYHTSIETTLDQYELFKSIHKLLLDPSYFNTKAKPIEYRLALLYKQ